MKTKSKVLSLLLCVIMIVGLLPATVSAAEIDTERPVAVVSKQTFTIDGVEKTAEIYSIDGYNYFKLRDIAALLKGTAVQFSVDYDAATRRIDVITGETYAGSDTDLVVGVDHSASCIISNQPLYVNGELQDLRYYNMGGSNFFKLRDLGEVIGFAVHYDEKTNAVAVTTAKQTVRMGFTGDMMIVYGIAEELGLWEKEFGADGIEVTATQVQNAPTFLAKVADGEMDFGIFGDQGLIQAYARGQGISIVGSYADVSDNWFIVARKDSGIMSASDLVGKRIAFEEGTAAGKKWDVILEVEGIAKDTVEIIGQSSIPDQIKAMQEGTVDAFLTNTIYLPEVEQLGGYIVAPYSDFGVDMSAMAVGTSFAESNPELVSKIIKVFAAEAEWTTTHREEAIQYISVLGNYTMEEAAVVYDAKNRYVGYNEEIKKAFNDTAEFLYMNELIDHPVTADEFVDTTFLPLQTVRMGFTGDMMIVYGIAEELGLWEKEFGAYGIEVTATQVQNAPTFLAKVADGEMEFGIFGDQGLIQAYARGQGISIVGSYADVSDNWFIVARKDSGIMSASDLVGKRIAFEEGTAAGKKWDVILEVEGIAKDTVEIIGQSSIPDQIKAMQEGTVDAFLTNTIYLPEVEQLGGYIVAPYSDFGVDMSAMAVGTSFAESNPELVSKIIKVFAAEAEWTTTHREEAIQYISVLGNYTMEEAAVVYDAKNRYVGYNEEIKKAFNDTAEFLYMNELIDHPVTADEFVDTSFLALANLY